MPSALDRRIDRLARSLTGRIDGDCHIIGLPPEAKAAEADTALDAANVKRGRRDTIVILRHLPPGSLPRCLYSFRAGN